MLKSFHYPACQKITDIILHFTLGSFLKICSVNFIINLFPSDTFFCDGALASKNKMPRAKYYVQNFNKLANGKRYYPLTTETYILQREMGVFVF